MYLTQYEQKRKQRKNRVYTILASIMMLFNVILFIFEGNIFRGLLSLVIFLIALYYHSKEKVWAMFFIKMIVFIHLILLMIIIIVSLVELVM
ncbi:hypothetical protein [Lysinibacillus xylanilyticus]|uniref:hypothetical protein n=1 Tax=Lysinibacillus xylanilyticus TaxID=582475 RepID=UPI003CFCEF34